MIFAPERMIRMDVLALCGDVEKLTKVIAQEGSVHVMERELPRDLEHSGDAPSSPSLRGELNRLSNLAAVHLQQLNLTPVESVDEAQDAFRDDAMEETLAAGDKALKALGKVVDKHFRQQDVVEAEITCLNEISEQMNLLNDNGLTFLDLKEFKHFYAGCGTIARGHVARLKALVAEEPCALTTRPVSGRGSAFLLIGELDQRDHYEALVKDAGAHALQPPERFVGSFEDGLEQIEIELWMKRDELAELMQKRDRSQATWHETLSEWTARLRMLTLLDDAVSRFGSDGMVTLISGFVPVSRKTALVRRLEKAAKGLYFARFGVAEPTHDVPTPTRLRNWRLLRPFELFVKTYGLPGYNDVDPTPFVAVSFLLMFGMMFGDVGHGLVLAAIGAGIAFLPYQIFSTMRDLGRILLMAGLSGTFFGFLFGSVFGVEEDAVLSDLWMRPSHPENLSTFLVAALGLGVVVLSTGIILNIVQALRQRNIRKALIGQWSAASLVFFWGLLLLFGLRVTGNPFAAVPAVLLAAILSIPLLLIVGGQITFYFLDCCRHGELGEGEEEEQEELATILFEPVEIVMNLFTNLVSFLRVAAFGLAHAALTMAVFVVNDMVDVPGASILSLPMEHLLIIVMEGLIVTIQCLRLEYYEFFSKFFTANGVPYTPLVIRRESGAE